MSLKAFGLWAGLFVAALLGYGAFLLTHQWSVEQAGAYTVRRNVLTGKVELRGAHGWLPPFTDDPYADALPMEELQRVRLKNIAWGKNGVLCALAVVAPPARRPVQGRLAFLVRTQRIKDGQWLPDRALRANVNWAGNAETPFVLRTGLTSPDPKTETAFVRLLPTSYSGL